MKVCGYHLYLHVSLDSLYKYVRTDNWYGYTNVGCPYVSHKCFTWVSCQLNLSMFPLEGCMN